MRVLVVGSGGREHTLTWKLAQSPQIEKLLVAPGNGGTADIAENVPITADDIPALAAYAQRDQIDLTIVGPEAPLAAGLVDAFQEAGLRVFGPSAAAAQLESSKAFAKRFMVAEGIPTAKAAIFQDHDSAWSYLRQQGAPVVVKASGLAAGKGVIVCQTLDQAEEALRQVMVEKVFGAAGDEVLIEDCLEGEEASLMAFSDGSTVVPMLPARDYKRVNDGDLGPNTGGMGCYAPSPFLPPAAVEDALQRVLQPAVDGMRRHGTPYVGVLYAGLMLTDDGPQVIEFNCRFGDPETQVVLPLLENDLLEVILACIDGRLDQVEVSWSKQSCACIVLASGGYPGAYAKGKAISGTAQLKVLPKVVLFHAGAKLQGGQLLTSGGRVMAAMCSGADLDKALAGAYAAVEKIHFEGVHYRTDIGAGAAAARQSAYAAAGVDIEAKMDIFKRIGQSVKSTYTPAVLADFGTFGGLFALEGLLKEASNPVLVSSTDSVGTKTIIADAMGLYDGVGRDIVNHCINDVLVQGARPLMFMDYVAAGKLEPKVITGIVESCAAACRESGAVLIAGETAEMPGVYRPGAFDLVGALVGWVEKDEIINGADVRPGDVCLGLPSSGLHTNGYSLARHVFGDMGYETVLPELGRPVGEVLLVPHKSYLPEFDALVAAGVKIKAMSHITGGGYPDNLPRVLPAGVGVHLDRQAWEAPPIFQLIQQLGQVDELEMYRVYNMGVGMVVLVDPAEVDRALAALDGKAYIIGAAVAWDGSGQRVQL